MRNPASTRASALASTGIRTGLFVVFTVLVAGCASTGGKKKGPEPEVYGRKVEFSEAKQAVRTHVADPQRGQAMLELVDRAEWQLGELNETFKKQGKDYYKKSGKHDVGVTELNIELRDWYQEVRLERNKLLDTFFKIKEWSTEEEWSRISPTLFNSLLVYSDQFNAMRAQAAAQGAAAAPGSQLAPAPVQ